MEEEMCHDIKRSICTYAIETLNMPRQPMLQQGVAVILTMHDSETNEQSS